ncbi:MAG: response regulator transcription factor [Nitrospiraceae bacterium]|jgi:two-component system invasion response regulator UvrY|nr:response regulator transcription factor [Nitrospiraceae bacterium]
MIKILIADDHAIFRHGLRQILEENPDMFVGGEASNGQDVLDQVWRSDFDLLLLDINMPGMSGLEALKQLKTQKPKLKVLVLSMYPEEQYAIRALKAGASGYITKASASEELIEAIRKVSQGGKYVSASLAEKLLFDFEADADRPLHELLSDREYEVLCMIASGKTVSHIAEELCLSVKTVSTHRVRILEKMRMKNNAELTNYAIKQKLIDISD